MDFRHPPLAWDFGIWGYVYTHRNTHEDLLWIVLPMELSIYRLISFNIQSLSITIGKCVSLSIVVKFDNNSDLQKFEKFALALLQQLRKTFTFKEGGFPGVTIFNYEGEASLAVSYTHLRAHETPEHRGCRVKRGKK